MPLPPRPFQADDVFYRLIPQLFINVRKHRISAGAFDNTTGTNEMSADWALLTTPEQSMAPMPSRAVGRFTKQLCDDLEQTCRYAPVPGNDVHCDIVGAKPERVRAAFARQPRLVLWPDDFVVPENLIFADGA